MLREIIQAHVGTDVEAVVSRLRVKCAKAGIAPPISDLLAAQTREVLWSLVEQGRRIAAVGSQMEATREIGGEGYLIRIIFREGVRRSFVQRVFDRLRGG